MLDERFDRMGDVRLTTRQSACISLVARGMSSKEIARELGISPSTVDNHVATAMRQFGFTNRSAVARWYLDCRESATAAETWAASVNSHSKSYVRLLIPTLGGIRNSLSVKERLFAILQVMIVSIMVTSAVVSLVLGLIFFLKLAN